MDFHIQSNAIGTPFPPLSSPKGPQDTVWNKCRTEDLLVNKGNSAVKCSQNYDKTDSKLRFGIVMIFVRCLSTGNLGSVFMSHMGFI